MIPVEKIYFLSGNPHKFQCANPVFQSAGITLMPLDPEIPEIQADTSLSIAKHGAEIASRMMHAPVLREDHSLFIDDFLDGRFPWPYGAYCDRYITAESLLPLLYPSPETSTRTGYFELGAYLAFPDGSGYESVSGVRVEFSREIHGSWKNLDRILMIPWSGKTFAESDPSERYHLFQENFRKILLDYSGKGVYIWDVLNGYW